MNETRLRIGFVLLIPALLVFSIRAGFALAGNDLFPAWPLAVVGILSGLGMLFAAWATYKTVEMGRAWIAIAIALIGHYIVRDLVDADLGGALVYLGTGFLVSLRLKWAQYGALMAGAGALLRGEANDLVAQGLLILGALTIAAAAFIAVRRPAPDPEVKKRSGRPQSPSR